MYRHLSVLVSQFGAVRWVGSGWPPTQFLVSKAFPLTDQELSFNGPAQPDVQDAWHKRFTRMELLRRFCGASAESVEDDFLACLSRSNHPSLAKVHFWVANTLYP